MTWDDEDGLLCHLCDGQRPAMSACEACQGRGRIDSIGFLGSPWDEVAPGLWVGAHDIASHDGRDEAVVGDEFDVVVSLFRREGHGPSADVEHHHHAMPDAELDADDAASVEALAALVDERLNAGKSVLIRCQAGLNRSSLVAALVLMRRGSTAEQAIAAIRAARSPNCLFNRHFSAYLKGRPA